MTTKSIEISAYAISFVQLLINGSESVFYIQ